MSIAFVRSSIFASVLLSGLALAQSAPAPTAPPQIVFGAKDITLAPAGTYNVDPAHTAIVARVPHIGYSFSIFRFGKVQGSLAWDPKAVGNSKLNTTVETNSIETPVPGFAEQLQGAKYLNSAAYPQATFVTTAFRQKDATHGEVDGTFTLMGKSKPVTFDVSLVGAGPGFFGHPRMGIHAETTINPQDYGFAPIFGTEIGLVIDAEFQKG
jgi:polyisoprenoid-binding protein YceI